MAEPAVPLALLRLLLSVLGLLLLGYLLFLALLFVQQRSMMFPGTALSSRGEALPEGADWVELPTAFGPLRAAWLPASAASRGSAAALYFHGNYELVEHNVQWLAPLRQMGLSLLLIEYPGYAGNPGSPSRTTLNEAARAGYDWLAAHAAVDRQRIIAIGRSIGSGPAAALAAERPLRGVILISPFAAISDFARQFGAPSWLVRDRFDNRAALAAYSGPVLLLHGRDDGIIPPSHSAELLAVSRRAQRVMLPCGHNDCDFLSPPWLEHWDAFLHQAGVLLAD